MRYFMKSKSVVLTASTIAAMCANVSLAENNSLALEEVVVTAQKREQNLQDVPISVQAMSGDEMRASGIEKMDTLAVTIPAMHVSEAFGGDQIFLRGLGPGVNFGFEQAVGTVVDGFFYGRSRFSRLQFLDLERVEVLKGPQGAIIGKNTTAGAINITTKRPTEEFEAWITVAREFEGAEGETYEGAVSGPLTDVVKARLALRSEDKDGFLKNRTTGNNDERREDLAGRLSILAEPHDSFSTLFQYAFSDVRREGRNIQAINCSADMLAVIAANNINEDCKLSKNRSHSDTVNGVNGFEFQDTKAETVGLTLNWELDQFSITSLTGYAEYEYTDWGNPTHTAIENFMIQIDEDYEQFSQEIRIAYNGNSNIDYIAGIFYQTHQLDSLFDFHVLTAGPNIINRNRHITTEQEGDSIAAFGQLTWRLNDEWDITLEGRYTEEEKDARSIQLPAVVYTTTPVPGPGAGGPAGVFNVHDISDDRSKSDFSPGLVVQWRPTDSSMYYASIKRGFKGGGFDHQLNAPQSAASDGRFNYDDEEVVSVELGGKLRLANGAARLNFSIFRNEYDNLQVSSAVGQGTFEVGNAASAVTQGAEADLQWRLTEALTLSAALSLLNAKYDEFDGAPCNRVQIDNGLCPDGLQDLSNQPLQFAPDYSYNMTAEYVWPLRNGLELVGFVRVYGEDEKELALDLDPNNVQGRYSKVDSRLTLAHSDGSWQVSLIGRNLGDELTMGFGNDNSSFPGSYYGMTESPRSLIVQGTFRF